ncbi:MAG: aminotransferase class I/II-fold pyridoxal phosphate-dependent enzyme [Phycisphaerae bacterium]|nr:aminotransferase class I/II-fold pyridoxal phosphate-dependent enzyme [Phycisphaerae bacterium]
MSDGRKQRGMRTRAIHAGEQPDPVTGASAPNLVMSTSFVTENPEASFSALELTEDAPYAYTRWGNPTTNQLEAKLADIEGAEAAIVFASGMAATIALLLHRLRAGDHLIVSDIAYAGVSELVRDTLTKLSVDVTCADLSDLDEFRRALRPETKLVLVETPANPILRLTDIRAVADLAHKAGAELVVDSTFATPIATRPIEHGADYVLHSLTKYLCGHGDALGGAVLGRVDRMLTLRRDTAIHLGGVLSPFNAWLIMRGIATLPIRMAAHADSAMKVSRFLEAHPRVTRVIYPGLPSHPQHALAKRQMDNYSAMLTFQVADGPSAAKRMAERLEVIHYAVSLGHHRSLVFYLPTAELQKASFRLDDEHLERYRTYAGDGVFRLSVGLEDADDLCADLDQALADV